MPPPLLRLSQGEDTPLSWAKSSKEGQRSADGREPRKRPPSPSDSNTHSQPGTTGLFTDGEEAVAPEDVSKWTVDDVCSFVGSLSGCGEYAPVRGHRLN